MTTSIDTYALGIKKFETYLKEKRPDPRSIHADDVAGLVAVMHEAISLGVANKELGAVFDAYVKQYHPENNN